MAGEGIDVERRACAQRQGAVSAVDLGVLIGAVVHGAVFINDGLKRDQIEAFAVPGLDGAAHAVKGEAHVAQIADVEQGALAEQDLLATDTHRAAGIAEREVHIDEGLGHIGAVTVAWCRQLGAPGAGVLHLQEGAHRVVEQVKIRMQLEALHHEGIVLERAKGEVRVGDGAVGVAHVAAEHQPGRGPQIVKAHRVERFGPSSRVLEKAVIGGPA